MREQLTLGDVGEFRLINEIILPKLAGVSVSTRLGDDCAFADLASGNENVVITSDVTPKPLVWELGLRSYYTWGWYSVLTNVSDLATTGADPVAFTTSIEASPSMAVSDFSDFFSGLHDACKCIGIPNAGGNINESSNFSCHGTAIGTVPSAAKIRRAGMATGDAVYIIGESGLFMSLFLKARKAGLHSLSNWELERLTKPNSLLLQMRTLRHADAITAASDNSDGILGALWNLCEGSERGIDMNLKSTMLPELVLRTAYEENIDPWNLFFSWGDWQQVVAVKQTAITEFESIVKSYRTSYARLGNAVDEPARLSARVDGEPKVVNLVRNENFRPYSYNSSANHSLEHILHAVLFEAP